MSPGLRCFPQLSQSPAEIRAVWGPPAHPWAVVAFASQGPLVQINYVQVRRGAGADAMDFIADGLRAARLQPTCIESSIVSNTTILRLIAEGKRPLAERLIRMKASALASGLGAELADARLEGDPSGGWKIRVALSY